MKKGRVARATALRSPALPPMLRTPLVALSMVCGLVAILLGAYFSGTDDVASPFDDWARTELQSRFPDAARAALVIDFGGEPIGAIALSGLLATSCLLAGRWRLAVLAVTSQGVVGGVTNLTKPIVDRTINGGNLCYPSGHTAGATALSLVLVLLLADVLRLGRCSALLLAVGVTTAVGAAAALAQTWLIAHYATDTIGGFAMAVAVIPPTALLVDRISDRLRGADPVPGY